jgi:hypothetical protein
VKAKGKGGGKIAWLDYGGAEHFIARMGYKIRADVSIHKRFYFQICSLSLACPTHYGGVLRSELKSSRTATASISAVWGNMSKGWTAIIRYLFRRRAKSRARVAG